LFKTSQEIPAGFNSPTALPASSDEARVWQEANRSWWEQNPMQYDFNNPLKSQGSDKIFEEIDGRFFALAGEYLYNRKLPFDQLIPFAELANKDVLEIGVGSGSHAALLAAHARSFTGIDLTEAAIRNTTARFRQFGLPGRILQMDAEKMAFPDASFDFIWTWGVIHHSADTAAILREMRRVLRPGGRAIVMVYHRSFWEYQMRRGVFFRLYNRKFWHAGSTHRVTQMSIDGGLARFYTKAEWRALVDQDFVVDKFEAFGQKAHVLPLPSRFREPLAKYVPKRVAVFLLSGLAQGQYLVAHMTRKP
jgi:ubiquinone/menaquinone biosynthesis C-methylase UbiE